eukprot:CAMPEP_0198498334 /NCGR_PEP_ID=MMETSP1462-20131121/6951_1 /TAXON_ID=1333877 /ORGANISM="Brandtodinium nutriculum, Strain RCC3387" /LENGTH=145 /DNA_ID=CAMNT_0044227247 /DNA_START=32 /DNA_END=469 /DNA_ORIENTATION=+
MGQGRRAPRFRRFDRGQRQLVVRPELGGRESELLPVPLDRRQRQAAVPADVRLPLQVDVTGPHALQRRGLVDDERHLRPRHVEGAAQLGGVLQLHPVAEQPLENRRRAQRLGDGAPEVRDVRGPLQRGLANALAAQRADDPDAAF